jgi:hypothetical protein
MKKKNNNDKVDNFSKIYYNSTKRESGQHKVYPTGIRQPTADKNSSFFRRYNRKTFVEEATQDGSPVWEL